MLDWWYFRLKSSIVHVAGNEFRYLFVRASKL